VIQNPYGMCYLSIYSLKLLSEGYTWKKSSPFFVDSGTAFVDKSNVAHWPSLQAALTSKLQATWINYFTSHRRDVKKAARVGGTGNAGLPSTRDNFGDLFFFEKAPKARSRWRSIG